jgi:hypothetical protein
MGAGPTLALLVGDRASVAGSGPSVEGDDRFTPVDLAPFFNATPRDFGPRERARTLSGDSSRDGLIRVPAGEQKLRGIPFRLGPEGLDRRSWLVLSTRPGAGAAAQARIALGRGASFLCLALFCDWDPNEMPPPLADVAEKVGQRLAEAVLVYEDGGEERLPLRRRFEVCSPSIYWGHLAFAALPHREDGPRRLADPLSSGAEWGGLQTAVADRAYAGGPDGLDRAILWVCALANPHAERPIAALHLEASAEDALVVCGLTLFHGRQSPLRRERLVLYRITLPEPLDDPARFKVEVDLGVVARLEALADLDGPSWLMAPGRGLGEPPEPLRGARCLYAEVSAAPDARLSLRDGQSGRSYEFDLRDVRPGQELEARPAGARVEIVAHDRTWLHGRVTDAATGRPTPVRLAFRSREGRYIPPYGHRTDINDGWFQDYGADVKLMDSPFAYVDGTFQVELPVGEVYLEMSKGFEYEAVRQRLEIKPGQRELSLGIPRFVDLRPRGWMTADTHVHFLSPSTAVLEGQAEGLNLVNLLAAQWGDLFTNVGDLPQGPLTSRDGETIVWVGTENRQHILGHLGLLGGQGEPVQPMSAGGPGESYLGDPVWTSLADWADRCRQRDGLVVAVHFPYPTAELAADIVLGKVDAVELRPEAHPFRPSTLFHVERFNSLAFLDWYRYLNCGYRLPAVGGTDKMGAYMPVGALRTYAQVGSAERGFAAWAEAVRKGRTFMTTGPLLLLEADGHTPGDEITLGAGGGTLEVQVEVRSFVPFHRIDLVVNGRVVAAREEPNGSRETVWREKVSVAGPGWLAARCSSHLGPTTSWLLGIVAHTSPLYLRTPGSEPFSQEAAAYILTLVEGADTWLTTLATRPDPESFARIRQTLAEARERLHRRMHEHGLPH